MADLFLVGDVADMVVFKWRRHTVEGDNGGAFGRSGLGNGEPQPGGRTRHKD